MSTFGEVERVSEVRLASLPAPGAHVVFASAKVRARRQALPALPRHGCLTRRGGWRLLQGLRRALEAARPGAAPQEPPPVDPTVKRGLASALRRCASLRASPAP